MPQRPIDPVQRAYEGQIRTINDYLAYRRSVCVSCARDVVAPLHTLLQEDAARRRLPVEFRGATGDLAVLQGGIDEQVNSVIGAVARNRGQPATPEGNTPVYAIRHLDLLALASDGQLTAQGQNMLFALAEGFADHALLAFTDLTAPSLPAALHALFEETVHLEEIDQEGFRSIIGEQHPGLADHWQAIYPYFRHHSPMSLTSALTRLEMQDTRLKRMQEAHRIASLGTWTRPEDIWSEEWDQLGGMGDTILTLNEFVIEPFKRLRESAEGLDSRLGRAVRRTILLYGPPGTGKTYLARWLASQLGVALRTVSPFTLKRSLYGESERTTRRLFSEARASSPSLLIFDEMEDLFQTKRDVSSGASAGVVNVMLEELDGIQRGGLFFVIGTTNRIELIEPAARSRFQIKLEVLPPSTRGCTEEIVKALAKVYKVQFANGMNELLDLLHEPIDRTRPGGPANRFAPRQIRSVIEALVLISAGQQEVTDDQCCRAVEFVRQQEILERPPDDGARTAG